MRYQFEPMRLDHINECISLIEAAFRRNLSVLSHEYESTNKLNPPWSWFGQEKLHFFVLKDQGKIIAYVIWRNLPHILHLHSFLVDADYQGKGIGKFLLKKYEEEAISMNPNAKLFTLHTYIDTAYNHIFYRKNGYHRYETGDENRVPWLKEWIHNCSKHNDWPLTNNKILFYKEYGG